MIDLTEPYDVYLTTEVKEISNGGISKWVDDWLENVAPHLVVKPVLIVEIQPTEEFRTYALQYIHALSRPGDSWGWEYSYRTLSVPNYFSLPDRRTVDMLIDGARKFHMLSYPIPIMMEGNKSGLSVKQMRDTYKRDIDSLCVHSRESKTLKYQQKKLRFGKKDLDYQKKSIEFQELLISDAKETIWIGINDEDGFDYTISNTYEFNHNLSSNDSNVIGFPARCEARKNINYTENLNTIALTSENSVKNYLHRNKLGSKLHKLSIEEYRSNKIEEFFKSNSWGISHSCYENEPFGYSIFQSVDFGKIPILSKDWCIDMDYPFRASSKIQFERQVAKISKLSVEERNNYLEDLRTYLKRYSNNDDWRDDLLSIYNKDGDQVWLPTNISPSKGV